MNTRHVILSLALLAFAAPSVAGAASPKSDPNMPVEKVYDKLCRNCHGSDGKAQTKMGRKHEIEDMTDAAWQKKKSDAEIRDAIWNGVPKTKMKAYKNKLTEAQADALVKYVRAFGKQAP